MIHFYKIIIFLLLKLVAKVRHMMEWNASFINT